MTPLSELLEYLDTLLEPGLYQDYCPNGLQVEGRDEVRRIVCGVTASQALIDAAVAAEADTLLVHHGYFWRGEDPRVVGIKRQRLGTLLQHRINLIAYHLPLDGHPDIGNNAQLAHLLGFSVLGRFGPGPGGGLAMYAQLPEPVPPQALGELLTERLGRSPLWIDGGPTLIHRVGWCSGAAQSYLESADSLGIDAFISGEVSEPTYHFARELGVHYFAAGHHATERYGVQALGRHIAERFEIDQQFIDIYNPI